MNSEVITPEQARSRNLVALTSPSRYPEYFAGVCEHLSKGGIDYALVRSGSGLVEVWRAEEGFIAGSEKDAMDDRVSAMLPRVIVNTFRERMKKLGYANGKNITYGKFFSELLEGKWRRVSGAPFPVDVPTAQAGGWLSLVLACDIVAGFDGLVKLGKYPSRAAILWDIAQGNWVRRGGEL